MKPEPFSDPGSCGYGIIQDASKIDNRLDVDFSGRLQMRYKCASEQNIPVMNQGYEVYFKQIL